MGNRRSPVGILRAPLGHWIIAAIFAAGIAWGTHAWLAERAVDSAQAATLSWDAAVARRMDPSLTEAAEPAVATAQSILTDSAVASLAQSASLSLSVGPARIGEFRSRLELRQPAANQLRVRFRDTSPEHAAQIANLVARALANGTAAISSPLAATAPAAAPPPRVAVPLPLRTPVDTAGDGNNALVDSLQQLQTELSATQSKVDNLNADAWQRREHPELSSYRQSKQQQLLTAQVGTALKELTDLRANPENSAAVQEPLRRIQDALRSVWPASRADKTVRSAPDYTGFNAAGVDAGRLREERAEFSRAIAVVQKEQQAVQRLEPVESAKPEAQAQGKSADRIPPPAAEAPAAAPTASASSSGAPPPIAESEIPKPAAEQPFQLLRPAGVPQPTPLWPGILAGSCCGLLYLMVAGSRYGEDEEEEELLEESLADSQRMITPSKPLRAAGFFESSEPSANDIPPNSEPRSTSFFDSAPPLSPEIVESAPPRSADYFERVESSPAEIVLPHPQIEAPDLPSSILDEKSSHDRVQEITMDADETKRPFQEEVVKADEAADPWVDTIMRTLSETSIGRLYEKPASADRDTDREDAHGKLSIRPNRLAG